MKTDKKIEEILDRHHKWEGTLNYDEAIKELTRLLNTEVQKAREEAVEKYKEEQAKSILEKGNPDWLGFDTPDRKLSKKYKELLKDKE